MGMTLDSVASPQPAVRFFDVLSWRKEQRTDGKWTGFHKLAAKVCPAHSGWLKTDFDRLLLNARPGITDWRSLGQVARVDVKGQVPQPSS